MLIITIVWEVTFGSYQLHHCDMHTSHDCRQSPLKALLNTFGMCHKTCGMVTRYRSQDTKDVPDSWYSMIRPMNIVKKKLTLATPWHY